MMKKYRHLRIIGTSHIAKESLKEVEQAILELEPSVIAIELDHKRLIALFQKTKSKLSIADIKRIGVGGYIFSKFGSYAERKLGDYVGVTPGSEMKKAITLAKEKNIPIALIDQDIEITLRNLKRISWKEKRNFIVDILGAIFKRKPFEFDLTKVPSQKVIEKMMASLKKRYPNVHSVLIEERNRVMANNLKRVMEKYPDKLILAVMGAGHVNDVITLLSKEIL